MRLGLIARADSRGLGIQTLEFSRHIECAKILVIDCPSVKPLPIRHDWYPNATWVHGMPTPTDYATWLQDLDVIYTAESPYHHSLFAIAEQLGVRSVLHLNYELFDYTWRRRESRNWVRPTLFAAPSVWHWDDIPDPKAHLPVPVATDRFTPQEPGQATNFLHIVGRPAIHDRNGTTDLLWALQNVHSEITLTLRSQEPGYIASLITSHDATIPDNITLNIQEGDTPNYWDLYTNQHVLVLPRRYGGLCLPAQEACGAGIPAIMPNLPENQWLPTDWLITTDKTGEFQAHNPIDLHTIHYLELAMKIDQFASDHTYYRNAATQAQAIGKHLSWDQLRPEYERVLGNV